MRARRKVVIIIGIIVSIIVWMLNFNWPKMTIQLDLFSFVIKLEAHKAPEVSSSSIDKPLRYAMLKPLGQKNVLARNPFRF